MEEKQNLRYDLLKANNYDIKKSQAGYDFVMGKENTERPKTNDELADGIYLIPDCGAPLLFTGQSLSEVERSPYKSVGIKLGNKSLAVALSDTCEAKTELTERAGGSRFITDYHEAVADWNGKENTDDMRAVLRDNAKVGDNEYIPSLGELYFILLHILDVNDALKAVGGEPLSGWYWSSTGCSAGGAWYLYLSGGVAYCGTKAASQRRVRAVSAFLN